MSDTSVGVKFALPTVLIFMPECAFSLLFCVCVCLCARAMIGISLKVMNRDDREAGELDDNAILFSGDLKHECVYNLMHLILTKLN